MRAVQLFEGNRPIVVIYMKYSNLGHFSISHTSFYPPQVVAEVIPTSGKI
jgi:hypothetical protein